ncbi:sperm flagellar protein 1 [Nasonia vitripennis]|uniref:CH-like domain-containing protein n=1 Tax=Nasonia vitripennis TaxID=7425 RepID=A0A7M7G9Z5_NASVI|nr:sperm flagellar protein 1 [Nasonia vitripennis]
MVANHGFQSKDEQMSEKCEVASIRSENPARIEDIFEWIDGIPLSKTTKNLARDFSDAVLMSEILKFYYPHLVSPHNYIPANSVQNKKENWNTLNRKVFAKINMHLSSETIDQLAHSQVGAIEKVLTDFRDKQMAINIKDPDAMRSDLNLTALGHHQSLKSQRKNDQPAKTSIFARSYKGIKHFFAGLFRIFLAMICFWKWFSRKPTSESVQIEPKTLNDMEEQQRLDEEDRLRDSYSQALEELRVKADVIKTLCHKVAFLEGTMKLKDMKIATLTSQLEMMPQTTNDANIVVSARQPTNNPLKLRKRPRTQV